MKLLNEPQCREEIRSRLLKVQADTPRLWGRMNASQMICHLSDSFLGMMGEKPVEATRGLNLWPLMKWFVLYAPIKWPHGVATRPEFDQQIGGNRPEEFASDMQRLLKLIELFTAQPREFHFRPNPMFNEMSDKDWMRWGYLHCDHHLRQFGA